MKENLARSGAVLLTTLPFAVAVLAGEPQLDFDLIFGDEGRGRQPSSFRWSPDGRRLLYRWKDDDGEALWVHDAEGGRRPKAIFRPGRAGTEDDFSLDAVHWSPDGGAWLIESDGDLFLLRTGAQLRRLTRTDAAEREPAFRPDGSMVAFVRDWDLHLIDLESGRERALTEGGERDRLLNGITDWVYWEEIWGRDSTGFWWSPDGARIAYYQFDEEPVQSYPLVDFTKRYPEVTWQKYPKAGTDNPRVRLGVLDLASGATVWLRTGPDPSAYLARLHWHPDGRRVAVQRLNREQDRLDLLLCRVEDGACTTLLTETHPTWVNLGDEFHWLPDGRFLWGSERTGRRQLYLHDAEGGLVRALTRGEAAVTSVEAVDAPEGWAVYTAHGTGPMGAARRQVRRVRLDGRADELLAGDGGWNGAIVAPVSGRFVHSRSTADTPTVRWVRDAGGEERAALPSEPPALDAAALPAWEELWIDGPDGLRLPAQRMLPAGFDETARYPVIMYHYGCPASQVVRDSWSTSRGLWHKMMAERGFLILKVDNGGSVFFGKEGEDRAHRRFGEGNLAAQEAAVAYLKGLPYVDAGRIGLWGWSGGGSNTLYALLNSPGTWRAGVAGAPVTDWRLYDTIWTERYLDHPDDNPEGYELSSAVTHAAKLEDALLIVHGTADDNVHPQNTLVMSHALVQEGKPFEQAIHPRQKHGYRRGASRHFYERMTQFFERYLGAPLLAE